MVHHKKLVDTLLLLVCRLGTAGVEGFLLDLRHQDERGGGRGGGVTNGSSQMLVPPPSPLLCVGPTNHLPSLTSTFCNKMSGRRWDCFFAGGEEEERKSYLLFALCISGLLARKKNAWDIWEGKKKYLFSWLIFDGVAIPVNNNGVKETKKIIVIFLVSHHLKTFYYFVILDPLKFFSSNSVFLSLFLTFAILDLLKLYSRNSLFLSRDCSNQPRHNKNRLCSKTCGKIIIGSKETY